MGQTQSRPVAPDEFLAWEAGQELKWEFDGFQPVAMTGGTRAHAVVQANLVTALTNRLYGKPCRAYGSDLKIQTGLSYRYPDASVSCTPFPDSETIVADPVVIFEVLPAGTAGDDRTIKLAEYQSLSSVRRYVMLEQDRVFATVITRTGTGWDHALAGPDGTLAMPEIGVEIPMAELHDGLVLAAAPQVIAPTSALSEAP
jgi:Uma2 family endonuclease